MTDRAPSAASDPPGARPRIAVFSGPTGTIEESPPLVTSKKARDLHGLPPLRNVDGTEPAQDSVRPQRLAAPVTLYIEAFSAHPLESDAAELYAPPDGYIGSDGEFSVEPRFSEDRAVFVVTIGPEDGLFGLPYMARRRDGGPWDHEGLTAKGPPEETRQGFYPDASRIFEEIDRFGLDVDGFNNLLSSRATYDFYRAAPSGGYLSGLPEADRTDVGDGDITPETRGEDFFYYRPFHLAEDPAMPTLARLTNTVQRALSSGEYDGAIWLEGTPAVEETAYWLHLLVDTTVPIACTASQRPHGALSNDGDRNIVDCVDYIRSRIWSTGADGADGVGAVMIDAEQIFTARDVQKADARPGGYVATGGHGGIIGTIGDPGPPMLTFWPAKAHTHHSAVNLTRLPATTTGVQRVDGAVTTTPVVVKDEGGLRAEALPKVTIVKFARYGMDGFAKDVAAEVEIAARIERNLTEFPLAGFVLEGKTPFGGSDGAQMAALRRALTCGMPVVQTARGNAEGTVTRNAGGVFIAGNNLTATKARLLLMACLMRFGCLPPARDPDHPTPDEWQSIKDRVAQYQAVFDTH